MCKSRKGRSLVISHGDLREARQGNMSMDTNMNLSSRLVVAILTTMPTLGHQQGWLEMTVSRVGISAGVQLLERLKVDPG